MSKIGLATDKSEIWVDLHYMYKGELFRFNLPLHQGEKFLDGLRIDFSHTDITGGRRLSIDLEPLGSVELKSFSLSGALAYGDNLKSVFVNGYQSWTGSRERSPGERISALNWPGKLLLMDKMGDAERYRYSEKKGRFHGYTYAYVRYPESLLFAGSLDERSGFTIVGIDVRKGLFSLRKDVEGALLSDRRRLLDMVFLEGPENKVFDSYMEMRGEKAECGPRAMAWIAGHGSRVGTSELNSRRSLAAVRERNLDLDYFVLDDGWQIAIGDWEPSSGFPSGMASLAAEIRGSGYEPGLWLAPFAVGVDSEIFRTKKEWLARDAKGRVRPAGWLSRRGGTFFALDISQEAVRAYLSKVFEKMKEWGFNFFKLDLLHVVSLFPASGHSRGEAMALAVDYLSSIKGDAVFEYSSVPLGSVFAQGEYCRVGADTTPYWEHLFKRNIHCRERASTLNALRATVGRRQLSGRFFSPSVDSFYLEDTKGAMEVSRRYTQMLLHYLFGGLIYHSGDISRYSGDLLDGYQSLFPLAQPEMLEVTESRRMVMARFTVNGRQYIGLSNLAERVRPFVLPEGEWFGAPGLRRRAHHVTGGGRQNLRPGESRIYMAVVDDFAGSSGHILPGCEIAEIHRKGEEWNVVPVHGKTGTIRVWLRRSPNEAPKINGRAAECITTSSGLALAIAELSSAESAGESEL